MSFCANCRHVATPPKAPSALLQIRRGYRARWSNLIFSVETDASQWTLRVLDGARMEILYTAHRGGAAAAKVAASEFAIIRVLGWESRMSPARLAGELDWQEYW